MRGTLHLEEARIMNQVPASLFAFDQLQVLFCSKYFVTSEKKNTLSRLSSLSMSVGGFPLPTGT